MFCENHCVPLAKMLYFTKPLYFMCCTQFNSHSVGLHYKKKKWIYKLVVKLFTLSSSGSNHLEHQHFLEHELVLWADLSDAFSSFTGFHPLSLFLSHWKWIKWVTFSKQLPVPPPLTPAVICLHNRNRISGPSIKKSLYLLIPKHRGRMMIECSRDTSQDKQNTK